jgi:GDP-D-mannose dehydratase
MKNNKKVLIVGINGFLGKELAGFLEGKGVEVFGTTHTSNISKNIFQFKVGDTINSKILLNDFASVVYLSHSASLESEQLINWYKKTS